MPALLFDKCCGCIELKTGCFILGYVNLVFSIIVTVFTIMGVAGGVVIMNQDDKNSHEAGLVVVIVSCILLVFMVLALTFAIVLLVGLHKNKPGHLKAYLIYSVIFLVMSIIQFIANCSTGITAGAIVQSIFTILLTFYFLLVIRSMYYQMKDPSRGPAIYSAA